MESIRITPGFCPNCGSILPFLRPTGNVKCYNCLTDWPPEGKLILNEKLMNKVLIRFNNKLLWSITVFGEMRSKYTIQFNTYTKSKNPAENRGDGDDGPIVERSCPKCGNDKMSYATLQLRSADEGQTVFYTCTNCKWVHQILWSIDRNITCKSMEKPLYYHFRFKETENS